MASLHFDSAAKWQEQGATSNEERKERERKKKDAEEERAIGRGEKLRKGLIDCLA